MQLINDIERLKGQKLTIGQRQQLISLTNQLREGLRNIDTNYLQIVARRLQIPQNELLDSQYVIQKAEEFLGRRLIDWELSFIRQNETIRKNSIIQLKTSMLDKLARLLRMPAGEIEWILTKHKILTNT
ncbi:MAG: hypothetical protein N3A62_09565 [Thermodesulfovibrionales bacterium]|nr:hypothetical protein [Thermodesulfovibrionales bacterium]